MKKARMAIEKAVRRVMRSVAVALNWVSRGHVRPNDVTIAALVMHIPIAIVIATDHLMWGAILVVIFGLFDTLDGELARLQNRVSDLGGLLDTVSDRIKELALYCGILYLFATNGQSVWFLLATMVACGASLITPFVKAKGEAIIATYGHEFSYDKLNRMFKGGFLPFEVRMAIIVAGLLIGMKVLPWLMVAMAVLVTISMLQRLVSIIRSLR